MPDKKKPNLYVRCMGCGEELMPQHWETCDWITCKCGHERRMHDTPDGCTWSSGRGLRCPCEEFKPRLSYEELRERSLKLMDSLKGG